MPFREDWTSVGVGSGSTQGPNNVPITDWFPRFPAWPIRKTTIPPSLENWSGCEASRAHTITYYGCIYRIFPFRWSTNSVRETNKVWKQTGDLMLVVANWEWVRIKRNEVEPLDPISLRSILKLTPNKLRSHCIRGVPWPIWIQYECERKRALLIYGHAYSTSPITIHPPTQPPPNQHTHPHTHWLTHSLTHGGRTREWTAGLIKLILVSLG